MRDSIGEPGSVRRQRVAIALVLGSPCVALLLSFSVIVVSRSLSDPLGWYAFDPVMAANGVLAVAGTLGGSLLRGGSTKVRVTRAMTYGVLAAIFYAIATFTFDLQTDWI